MCEGVGDNRGDHILVGFQPSLVTHQSCSSLVIAAICSRLMISTSFSSLIHDCCNLQQSHEGCKLQQTHDFCKLQQSLDCCKLQQPCDCWKLQQPCDCCNCNNHMIAASCSDLFYWCRFHEPCDCRKLQQTVLQHCACSSCVIHYGVLKATRVELRVSAQMESREAGWARHEWTGTWTWMESKTVALHYHQGSGQVTTFQMPSVCQSITQVFKDYTFV